MPAHSPDDLPLEIRSTGPAGSPRLPPRRFRRRYLLVLLVPLLMFTGAVIGMYFQPPSCAPSTASPACSPAAGPKHPSPFPPMSTFRPAWQKPCCPAT